MTAPLTYAHMEELAEAALLWAKDQFDKDRVWCPTAFLVTPTEITVALLPAIQGDRTACQAQLHRQVQAEAAVALIMVMDTWYVARAKPGGHTPGLEELRGTPMPSECPDRKEALTVTVFTPNGALARVAPYRRAAQGIAWEDRAPFSTGNAAVDSRWNPWRRVS